MDESKLKIKFTEDRSGDGYSYKKDQVYELSLQLCHRWVRRNAAVYVEVGEMETAAVPHEAKAPGPKIYKGSDGKPVEKTSKAVKSAKQ